MAKKNPLSPLDLAPLPATQNFSGDAEERVKQIKKLHERIREKIAKQNEKYQAQANKHRLFAEFKEGVGSSSKGEPRADGPFKVLKRIGENA